MLNRNMKQSLHYSVTKFKLHAHPSSRVVRLNEFATRPIDRNELRIVFSVIKQRHFRIRKYYFSTAYIW